MPDATLIEYMPECFRNAHREARNSGVYPHNGACRVWVSGEVAEEDLDPDWAGVVECGEPPEDVLVLEDVPTDALKPVEDDCA